MPTLSDRQPSFSSCCTFKLLQHSACQSVFSLNAMAQDRPSKKSRADVPLKSALKKAQPSSASAKTVQAKLPAVDPPNSKSPVHEKVQVIKKSAGDKKKNAINTAPKAKPKVDKGKAKAKHRPPTYPSTFKVVVGTYEKLLYGLEGSFFDEDGNVAEKLHLKPVFIFPAHVSCVKAVAASPDGGKWLATGSTDEIIKVWDLRRRKEIGGLVQHEG